MDIKRAMQALDSDLHELKTKLPGQTVAASYRRPTLAQNDKIERHINAQDNPSNGTKLAITLIWSVLDSDGKPVFDMGDLAMILKQVPTQTVLDIISEINPQTTIEEAEGN